VVDAFLSIAQNHTFRFLYMSVAACQKGGEGGKGERRGGAERQRVWWNGNEFVNFFFFFFSFLFFSFSFLLFSLLFFSFFLFSFLFFFFFFIRKIAETMYNCNMYDCYLSCKYFSSDLNIALCQILCFINTL